MKILVIQDALRSGGTERQSLFLSSAFADAGHAVTLLTFRPGGVLAPPAGAALPFVLKSLQAFDFGIDGFAPGLIRQAVRAVPDVVLCMGRMANRRGAGLQKALPTAAVVATLRTGRRLPYLYRRSLRRARHVVANSTDARDRLVVGLGLDPSRVTVIRNALLFPAGHAPGKRSLRVEFGAPESAVVLLSVAMFRRGKNQRELIEIVAGLPPTIEWRLWLAGDGPGLDRCKRLVRRRALEGRIRFLGYVSNPAALYHAADVAVHASSADSLSNFLVEAQAHGLPAVASRAQGVAECFVPGRTGWIVEPGDRRGFRDAIRNIAVASLPARQACGREAMAFARQAFDPAARVADYLSLFQRLTGRD